MSLYIGNLSEHTRIDELERVFRRFGHCNVRLKREGYGFVVFDFPPDATKALRALKGRNICGEPLTLTWSNKQPTKSFQRFARAGGRSYEPWRDRERNSERFGHARRKTGSDGWRDDHKMDHDGRGESVDLVGEERGYHQDDFKDYAEEEKDNVGEFRDDGGGQVPSPEENMRWGEQIQEPLLNIENENAVEFDRYEPYNGYDMKHDNDKHHVGYSGGSPTANSQKSMGRRWTREETANHPKDSKFRQKCYRCGNPGHKMRDCPKEHSSRREYNRLDGERNNKIDRIHRVEYEDKFRSDSLLKLRSSGDALSMRHQRDRHRVSASGQYHGPLRNNLSPIAKDTDERRRKEYAGKKRSRNEIGSPKRSRVKTSRQSISSSWTSDLYTSCSPPNSKSPKPLQASGSHSRSRSVSSRACSSSSKLRSSSKSQRHKRKSLNSRMSTSPTPMSVSLNQPLPSSPKKTQFNSKSSSINAAAFEHGGHLVPHGQKISSAVELENLQSKDAGITENGISAVCTTMVNATEKKQYVHEDNNGKFSLLNPSEGVTNLTKPHVDGNMSLEVVKETESYRDTGTVMTDDVPTEIQKQALETHVNSHSGLSTAISTEEMCTVLKNYGLQLPKDNERSLTVEAFFGSARMWPWHVVYYRRLKKGPISTENYARRVAQNQEFGIVDKYIRSSSGWGEPNLENS